MHSPLPESPQGLGDLLGLAFRVVRRNIGSIFRFILIPSLVAMVAGIGVQWAASEMMSGFRGRDWSSVLGVTALFLASMFIFGVAWLFLYLRLLAITRYVLGFAPDLAAAAKYMSERKWRFIGLNTLIGLMLSAAVLGWFIMLFLAGFLSSALAGALGVIANVLGLGIIFALTLVVAILSTGYYMLANCVLACEDESVSGSITRATQIISRHFLRCAIFGVFFGLLYAAISYPMSLPVAAIAFVEQFQRGMAGARNMADYRPAPMYLIVLTQIWESGMGFILRPLGPIAFGLFYYDLRLRSEGLDIRRKLQAIEKEQAAAGTNLQSLPERQGS